MRPRYRTYFRLAVFLGAVPFGLSAFPARGSAPGFGSAGLPHSYPTSDPISGPDTSCPADDLLRKSAYTPAAMPPNAVPGGASGLPQPHSGTASAAALDRTSFCHAVTTILGPRVGRFLSAKLLEIISVRDFGAKGDGKTDDSAAINAAIAYAKSTSYAGGRIWFPDGVYSIGAPIVLTGSGFSLVGSSPKSVTIRANYQSGNIIQIGQSPRSLDNENDGIYGINLTSSSPMRFGAAIYADGVYNLKIDDVRIDGPLYDGIDLENGAGTTYGIFLSKFWIGGERNRGLVIGANSTDTSHVVTDVFLSDSMILPGQAQTSCGICLYAAGGFYATGTDITNKGNNYFENAIRIAPSSGTDVNAVMLTQVLADSSINDNIALGGSGIIADVTITNGWASTSRSGSGIVFSNNHTDGVSVVATAIDSNARSGVLIKAGQNISIQNSRILNNSMAESGRYSGILIAPGVSHFTLTANQIGNGGWFNQSGHARIHQQWGIQILPGASDGYVLSLNRGVGNENGMIADGGQGASKYVSGNIAD